MKPCRLFKFCLLIFLFSLHEISTNKSTEDSKTAEAVFRKLYKLEREEQISAVKALLKLGTEEKRKLMVKTLGEKVFSVIQKSRFILEKSGYIAGESKFPTDEKVRDALANVLENIAFFGDIILRLPDITHELIKSYNEWNYLLIWGLAFADQTQLVDDQTNLMLNLVKQEMNYTERQSNYINPYRKKQHKYTKDDEITIPVKPKKPKKKIAKGPRLSRRTEDL